MDRFWETHWWLIIILAVFAAPIIQALFSPWRRYLQYRERRDAIEALKTYAAQGREPPPEVLDALSSSGWVRWRRRAAQAGGAASDVAQAAAGADRFSYRMERWRRREPLRRWNGAIFAGAITVGFAYVYQHVHQGADVYLVITVIAAAMTVAAVLSALMATFWRID